MKYPRVLSIIAFSAVVLTGCSGNSGQDTAESPTPSAPPTSASATTSPSPTSSASTAQPTQSASSSPTASQTTEAQCDPHKTGEKAYQEGLQHLAPLSRDDAGLQWAPHLESDTGFEPCADLAWAIVPTQGGTGSSPFQIMLFHQGEYLGTATKHAYGFHPEVRRLSDSAIEVTYRWPKAGEPNASASNTAISTFSWNEAEQKVERTGALPSYGPTEHSSTPPGRTLLQPGHMSR